MTERVLWLIRGLGPGGAEHLLASWARSPARRFSYDVALTRDDKRELVPALESAGVRTIPLTDGWWPARLHRLVRSGEYAIVHSHAPLLSAFARASVRTMRSAARPRLVATEHNVWSAYGRATRLANAVTFPADDLHIAVADAVRTSIPTRLARDVRVVVHGLERDTILAHHADRAAVRAELGIDEATLLVGTVANYRRHKDWPTLLHAARRVLDRDPRIRFVGVGQGPLRDQVEGLHDRLGLGPDFRLLGAQPDAARLIAALDVFCLASVQEGLPVALMEALVLGVPVVATAVGGVPEAVEDGREGRLVPPSSPERLADAILELGDAELRTRMASQAAERGRSFSIDRAVTTVEGWYTDLLAGQRA